MQHTRSIATIAIVSLLAFGAVLATVPAQAEESTELTVTIEVTRTSPSVAGFVTVFDAQGLPVAGAQALVTSTSNELPLPPASLETATGGDGNGTFSFPLVSTANVPGAHTLEVVVTFGELSQTASTTYTVAL